MATCTYCGSDLSAYDTLTLSDPDGRVGQFCNYGCLTAHVDAENLAVDDACEWSPGDATDCC